MRVVWQLAWSTFTGLALFVGIASTTVAADAVLSPAFVFVHENVLGTRLDVQIDADIEQQARRAETVVLRDIERLSAVFSTYDDTSEFSRWQRGVGATAVSPELSAVMQAADDWRQLSQGAFHPGVQQLSQLWKQAEQRGQRPAPDDCRAIASELLQRPWTLEGPDRSIARRTGSQPLSLNAIAKGFIVDSAADSASRVDGVRGVMVKIGGDLRVVGSLALRLEIADPRHPADNASPLQQIVLRNQGAATSGGAHRGFFIEGRRYSHIFDPRIGEPVDHVLSATVVAPTAMDADALATILCVLPVAESLELVEKRSGVECLIVDRAGALHASGGWAALHELPPTLVAQAETRATENAKTNPPPAWNGGMELQIDLEINQPDGGRRYRRPYVAIWIADKDGKAVRTLALWVQSGGPGPKWIPDLKRWFRDDRTRRQAQALDLVRTVAEPTRKPGQYQLVWDGSNDQGQLVPPGDYEVLIEAAREHGTYQLIRKTVTFDAKPFQAKLDGNVEIKAAKLDYRRAE